MKEPIPTDFLEKVLPIGNSLEKRASYWQLLRKNSPFFIEGHFYFYFFNNEMCEKILIFRCLKEMRFFRHTLLFLPSCFMKGNKKNF